MESFRNLTIVGPPEVNPVASLSVQDYLLSLARTPNPKRFDRRRQLLLDGRPRLTRVRRVLHKAGRSSSIEAVSSQHGQTPIAVVAMAQSPLGSGQSPRTLNEKPDSLTLEQTIHMPRLALLNPATDSEREEANEITGGNNIYTHHLSKQQFIEPITSPLSEYQQYQDNAGDTSMPVIDYAM
jgi:hypothetical protein